MACPEGFGLSVTWFVVRITRKLPTVSNDKNGQRQNAQLYQILKYVVRVAPHFCPQ